MLGQSFAWGRHAIAVRDSDREVRARLEWNACAPRHVDIDEIVG